MNRFKKLLFLILIFWTVLAILRTFYNPSKIITEEKDWIRISSEERRHKAYGNIQLVYEEINKVSKNNECISLYSKDPGISYYLLRYLLYPRKIYWSDAVDLPNISSEAFRKGGEKCKLVLIYNNTQYSREELKIVELSITKYYIGNALLIKIK